MKTLTFTHKDRVAYLDATAHELLTLFAARPSADLEVNQRRLDHGAYSDAREHREFAGGTSQDLVRPHSDFSMYAAAKEKLSRSSLMQSLKETAGVVKARSRMRSEHDGEWDYDRRWDVTPFTRREPAQRTGRIVNVDVYSAFSCDVGAQQINEYCTFVAAIIELIEASGVMVSLRMLNEAIGVAQGHHLDFTMRTMIKTSDQYLSPGDLLKVMSSNYYRRVFFMGIIHAAQSVGKAVTLDLGMPKRYAERMRVDKKTATLSLYSMPRSHEQETLMRELVALCTEGK